MVFGNIGNFQQAGKQWVKCRKGFDVIQYVGSLYLWLVAVCLVGFGAISPFVVIVVFVALLHRRKST